MERESKELLKLPIGIQTFEKIREEGFLYVDKTRYLVDIIDSGTVFFLSRPRRFGKSLTISTFDALFSGKRELFQGLAAASFFERPNYRTHPVIRLDMSKTSTGGDVELLQTSILIQLFNNAEQQGVEIPQIAHRSPELAFSELIRLVAQKRGPVVVLVDEYDKPILDVLNIPEKAERFRSVLRSLYTQIKGNDESIRFVFMTGITKFSKTGVFSAMNNLYDLSLDSRYATMLGYTSEELTAYFGLYIDEVSAEMKLRRENIVHRMREHYDGFSFDGVTHLYNPFSVLNFFRMKSFRNFWFESGSPSFIINYIKEKNLSVESYRGFVVTADFASLSEIEHAQPASFLFQAGYLTFKERFGEGFILDYPNLEVLSSISQLYASTIYGIGEQYGSLGLYLKDALSRGDSAKVIHQFNRMLAAMPHNLFHDDEKFYHSVFLTLLWGAGLAARAEEAGHLGRSDIVFEFGERTLILELKVGRGVNECERLAKSGLQQIQDRGYAARYPQNETWLLALAIDKDKRQVASYRTAFFC